MSKEQYIAQISHEAADRAKEGAAELLKVGYSTEQVVAIYTAAFRAAIELSQKEKS